MKAAVNRINYLRNYKAKELGVNVRKSIKAPKKVLQRTPKAIERDRNYHFYRFWLHEHSDVLDSKYMKLKTDMISASKRFADFHGRLFDVVQKFGNQEELERVSALIKKEVK